MSLEQALGHKLDHRTDIFSFGVVLYEAATSVLPFSGTSPIETINRIINSAPRAIADLNPAIPTGMAQIIIRCLSKDPEDRYRSAAEIRNELATVAAHPKAFTPIRSNLPRPLTSFIGRKHELSAIKSMLRTARLVTLTGPGGIGKTRLALQVALERLDEFDGAVWFVDLSPIFDQNLIIGAILSALDIPHTDTRDPLQSIADFFQHKGLLVIDNCEHLIDACAHILDSLLRRSTGLTLLTTSREPLLIDGENVVRVPCLAVPDATESTDGLLKYEAVRLFVDRATAAQPELALDPVEVKDVAEICRGVDGIPLALELAAARSRALPIGEIRARLAAPFRILSNTNRTSVPRQQTLRATVDWSHNLLSVEEQGLFRRICVFVGGFTLEAAEQVCADERIDRHVVAELITQLVDKSLVLFVPKPSMRYRLLETIRQYGREKLSDSGEEASILKQYSEFYVRWAEHASKEFMGSAQHESYAQVTDDYDNIRASLHWLSNEPRGGDIILRLVTAMRHFWLARGASREGRQWAEIALERSGEWRNIENVGAMEAVADLAQAQGDRDWARVIYDDILRIARAQNDEHWIGRALFSLGRVAYSRNDVQVAHDLFEQSLSAWERAGYKLGIASALGNLGNIACTEGNYDLGLSSAAHICSAQSNHSISPWAVGYPRQTQFSTAMMLPAMRHAASLESKSFWTRSPWAPAMTVDAAAAHAPERLGR